MSQWSPFIEHENPPGDLGGFSRIARDAIIDPGWLADSRRFCGATFETIPNNALVDAFFPFGVFFSRASV